jgi:uncharacterized membrane protein YedE/YeeE
MDLQGIGILIGLFILLLAGMFFIPRWLMRRAARQVVGIFRKQNAVDKASAKTIDELGLRPPSFVQRMMQRRDYKPQALTILVQAKIVKITEDGRYYLCEETLASIGLEQGASIYRQGGGGL